MQWPEFLRDPTLLANVKGTVAVFVVVLLLRALALRAVRRTEWQSEPLRLSWLSRIRTLSLLLLVLALILVWATELKTLALSAVAIAAALVLATKELILCITGGMVRKAGDGFHIGDRVEIGAFRGDVVDHGIMTTTILEAGPGHQRTGRAITLPNSMLLSTPVVNETFTDSYVLHVFSVTVAKADWQSAEALLLDAARAACEEFIDAARSNMERVSQQHGLSPPSVEPRVLVQLPDDENVVLLLRVPTPAREKARTEQEILRGFLERFTPAPAAPESGAEPAAPADPGTQPTN